MLRIVLACLIAFVSTSLTSAEDNWPTWRGPDQNGHYDASEIPLKWDESNIVWRTELPGSGQSSPCIWEDRVFLTANQEKGAERIVFAVDKNSGKMLWQQTVWTGDPEPSHALNGWASASCVTDGEHVYAFFGLGGLHCLTLDGERVWSRELGTFPGPWGTAASPILVRNMLIQNCDADENARLMAFDKKTGKTLWVTDREDIRGWSTPVLISVDGHEELVLNGDSRVIAYDPDTGDELWFCETLNGRGSPTATYANGLLHMINGKPADCYAIRPGGKGNVTETHRAWIARRPKGRDLPSPIVIGNFMVTCNMDGVYSTFNSLTGEREALFRVGGKHVAAPIAYEGKAIFIDEKGNSTVVAPPETIFATNSVGDRPGEIFRSTPVPNHGHLYIRSTGALYKIGK